LGGMIPPPHFFESTVTPFEHYSTNSYDAAYGSTLLSGHIDLNMIECCANHFENLQISLKEVMDNPLPSFYKYLDPRSLGPACTWGAYHKYIYVITMAEAFQYLRRTMLIAALTQAPPTSAVPSERQPYLAPSPAANRATQTPSPRIAPTPPTTVQPDCSTGDTAR